MADLDDELARFEAELRSLEQANASAEATDAKPNDAEDKSKKRVLEKETVTEPLKKQKQEVKVVIAAAPKVIMAPPRPAPEKKAYVDSQSAVGGGPISGTDGRGALPSTVEAVAAHRGALSGFPMGTSGELAAATASLYNSNNMRPAPVQRVDMVTGQLLSVEEQHMVNQQQSVYEYNPAKQAASSASARSGNGAHGHGKQPKKNLRMGGGEVWEDPTLADWPDNDFRLFCGDLGNEVSDELLAHSFSQYASFQRARVVRDKHTHKSRGYGFVSFGDVFDCAKALREMNGKYIGNRPVKITKSKWQDRNMDVAKKKMKKRRDKHHLFN